MSLKNVPGDGRQRHFPGSGASGDFPAILDQSEPALRQFAAAALHLRPHDQERRKDRMVRQRQREFRSCPILVAMLFPGPTGHWLKPGSVPPVPPD